MTFYNNTTYYEKLLKEINENILNISCDEENILADEDINTVSNCIKYNWTSINQQIKPKNSCVTYIYYYNNILILKMF